MFQEMVTKMFGTQKRNIFGKNSILVPTNYKQNKF